MTEDEAWTPLGAGDFGAELRGAAASALVARLRAGHAPTRELLRARLARHGVLALRPHAAAHSGDGDTAFLLGVATQLGRPRLLPRTTWVSADGSSRAQQGEIPAAPPSAVLRVIRNAEDTGGPIFGEQWHRDGSFCDQPPQATLWCAVDIPCVRGGRTRFASMDAFFHALPPELAAELQRCHAVHSAVNRRLLPPGSEGAAEGASRSCRPALGRHPADGRSYLDVCDGFTELLLASASVSEPSDAPSAPMAALLSRVLEALHAWTSSDPAGVVDWHWQTGDLVLLDNLRCVHQATGGVEGHRRELERVLADEVWA